jgi:hypothetical protein
VRFRQIEGGDDGWIRHQAPDFFCVLRLRILAEHRCGEEGGRERDADRRQRESGRGQERHGSFPMEGVVSGGDIRG